MNQERKFLREDAQAIVDGVRGAFASADPLATVVMGDRPFVLEKVSESELVVREPAESRGSRVILAGSTRPAAYPRDVPYIADEVVMLGGHDPVQMVVWFTARDPLELLATIESECIAEDWQERENEFVSNADIVRRVYRKGSLRRYLITGPGLVTMAQQPVTPAAGE